MNFWQIVQDHWIIAIIVGCSILGSAAQWSFKMWNRFMRMLMVRKHGWPPPHIDADGDSLEDDNETEGNGDRALNQINESLQELRNAYAESTRQHDRQVSALRDTVIHLIRQLAMQQQMDFNYGRPSGTSSSIVPPNALAEAYQSIMAQQMAAEAPPPALGRGRGRNSAAEARAVSSASAAAAADRVREQLMELGGFRETVRHRSTPAPRVQEPQPRPVVPVADAVSQADLDLGTDNTNEGQPETIEEVARRSGGELAQDGDEAVRSAGKAPARSRA